MDSHNERSPLLMNTTVGARSDVLSNIHNAGSDLSYDTPVDHGLDDGTLNEMMARFSTSVGSLGLGGPIQGACMMRRGSIFSVYYPSPRRWSSTNGLPTQLYRNATSQSTTRINIQAGHNDQIPCYKPIVKSPTVTADALVDVSAGSEARKGSEFLGGISKARFWAVFSKHFTCLLRKCTIL
jgi:hypothetical protein